ncbi:MAG: phosphate ABC transporter substrate-binding protein [Planctomycetes bacterium]|nr:phosphate ABC transporter substrate-binding protein [Planctomycetota bacterium]MCB9885101.1 phosphate ABC transporter substrate-binding protein [Planctomycetota bacterium]
MTIPRLPILALGLSLLTACGNSNTTEIQNLGSDTMLEVAGAWAEAYHHAHGEVVVSVSGGGSGTGIAALISGDVDIANCSRDMKEKEVADAKAHGHNPVRHHVGYDGIALYVHKDNPIASLTLQQLADMFGAGGKISKWSELGVDLGDPNADPIALVSRQNNSGTYEYFREAVLGGESGRFKPECNNLNGSKDVVDFCAKTKSAIGYSGLAYASDKVRIVPIVGKSGQPVTPSIDTVLDGTYPIARPLMMYTIGEPLGAVKHYLDWIKSDDGQRVLMSKHYPPLRKL